MERALPSFLEQYPRCKKAAARLHDDGDVGGALAILQAAELLLVRPTEGTAEMERLIGQALDGTEGASGVASESAITVDDSDEDEDEDEEGGGQQTQKHRKQRAVVKKRRKNVVQTH